MNGDCPRCGKLFDAGQKAHLLKCKGKKGQAGGAIAKPKKRKSDSAWVVGSYAADACSKLFGEVDYSEYAAAGTFSNFFTRYEEDDRAFKPEPKAKNPKPKPKPAAKAVTKAAKASKPKPNPKKKAKKEWSDEESEEASWGETESESSEHEERPKKKPKPKPQPKKAVASKPKPKPKPKPKAQPKKKKAKKKTGICYASWSDDSSDEDWY